MSHPRPKTHLLSLGAKIRNLREEKGWSQERLGVEIGLEESASRARVSRYELSVHEPPIATVRLISRAFGVPTAYFYSDDPEIDWLLRAWADSSLEHREAVRSILESI